MAVASPLARSLLAFACFALLRGASDVLGKKKHNPREHFDHHILANCAEYSKGIVTREVITLEPKVTSPYTIRFMIANTDHCRKKGKKLAGFLIEACDPLGPPGPSITVYSKLIQLVKCYTDGPCPSGLTVRVSQYCLLHH